MSEQDTPVHAIPARPLVETPKTEGEMVLEYIDKLHKELESLQQRYDLLDSKVNKELPAQLDQAFKDIQQNFVMVTKGIEAIGKQTPAVTAAAAQGQPSSGGIQGIIDNIINRVTQAPTGGGVGGLSDFDKEILKTSKQIQLISLRDVLKKTAKQAGVELAEHMIVNP
jgi:hypothetical protein